MAESEEEESSHNRNNKLLIEAMTKLIDTKLNAFRQKLQPTTDPEPNHSRPGRNPRRTREQPELIRDERVDDYYYGHLSSLSQNSQRRHQRREIENNKHMQDSLGGLKLKIPPFHGKNDPDAYLEWERKIELIFNDQHHTEINRVRVAATGFYDYALSWWDQLVISRRRNGEYPVETWREMKAIMRKRYVPSHYHRELLRRQREDDYHSSSRGGHFSHCSELDCGVNKEQEKTRRVQQKHHREGDFKVEIQEIEEMLHKALLFEQQVKRNNSSRSSYGSRAVTTQPSYSKEEKNMGENKPAATPTSEAPIAIGNKNKAKEVTTRVRDVKCFKCKGLGHYANECANKKTVTNPDNGDIISEEEEVDSDLSVEHLEQPANGELLEIQDDAHLVPMVEEVQHEQIIQSECIIQEEVSKDIKASFSVENGDDKAIAQPRRYTLFPTPDPYIVDFDFLEVVDYGNKKLLRESYDCEFQDAMDSRHMWLYNFWEFGNPGSELRLLSNSKKSEVDFIFGDSAFMRPAKCAKVLILEFLRSNAREEFADFKKKNDDYFLDFGDKGLKRVDELKTTIKKRSELFEWLVMIFGLSNTPSNFKRLKNQKLHNFVGKFVVVYTEDILVYSKNMEEYSHHLREVYEDYGVSGDENSVDESKEKCMRSWLVPSAESDDRSSQGFGSFDRRFVQNLNTIMTPIFECLKMKRFELSMAAQKGFEVVRQKLCGAHVLMVLYFDQVLEVEVKASKDGIGAALGQDQRPNAMVQTETFSLVFSDSMTVLTHLSSAKGVEKSSGTKETIIEQDKTLKTKEFLNQNESHREMTHKLNGIATRDNGEAKISKEKKQKPCRCAIKTLLIKVEPLEEQQRKGEMSTDFTINDEAPPWNQIHGIPYSMLMKEEPPDLLKHFLQIHDPTNPQGKCNVISSFNVSDLVSFIADEADLRSNPFEVGEDDVILYDTRSTDHGMDHLEPEEQLELEEQLEAEDVVVMLAGLITRSRAKHFNKAVGGLLNQIETPSDLTNNYKGMLMLIQAN